MAMAAIIDYEVVDTLFVAHFIFHMLGYVDVFEYRPNSREGEEISRGYSNLHCVEVGREYHARLQANRTRKTCRGETEIPASTGWKRVKVKPHLEIRTNRRAFSSLIYLGWI